MDKNELISKIDFNNVVEKTELSYNIETKKDYLVDSKGNKLMRLQPLDVKLIEKIKELEARLAVLESKIALTKE